MRKYHFVIVVRISANNPAYKIIFREIHHYLQNLSETTAFCYVQ